MNSYKYFINKIYPARINESSDIELYTAVQRAHFRLQTADQDFESLTIDFRNAFGVLSRHITDAINDGFRIVELELDDYEKNQVFSIIEALRKPFYDIKKLEEVLGYLNLMLSSFNLNAYSEKNQYEELYKSA